MPARSPDPRLQQLHRPLRIDQPEPAVRRQVAAVPDQLQNIDRRQRPREGAISMAARFVTLGAAIDVPDIIIRSPPGM